MINNYIDTIDTKNASINSNFGDYSNYTTYSDEFDSLFDCFIKTITQILMHKQCIVFPCELIHLYVIVMEYQKKKVMIQIDIVLFVIVMDVINVMIKGIIRRTSFDTSLMIVQHFCLISVCFDIYEIKCNDVYAF